MPGKSSAPALRRTTRLSRSSCLTDFDLYPLVRSSPTVPGLVTRPLCRVTPRPVNRAPGSGLALRHLSDYAPPPPPTRAECRNARPDPQLTQLRRQEVAEEEN